MNDNSLKSKTISGMIWNSLDRFGSLFITFITTLVLARLLDPADYGYVGMLMFFIAISDNFVEGGLGSALIQKQNPTQTDYSTIFFWNLLVSVLIMLLLYIAAPAIAAFYRMPGLIPLLRVNSLVLLFHAFVIIQRTILVKRLEFKTIATLNLFATFIGAVATIYLAYKGYGPWSLVAKSLVTSFFFALFLWVTTKWRPILVFSMNSFKSLFRFGGLLLLSNLVETAYVNLQLLIIGRVYTEDDLGYYSQANKMVEIPISALSSVVNQVVFPVFSKMQDNVAKLKETIRKNILAVTYLNFPICALLFAVAQPVFTILLSSKWDESIPYFQLLCISGMLYSLNTINTNIFKSLGKGKLFFCIQLAKRIVGIVFIVIGLQFGIMGMLTGVVLASYAFFFINAFFSGKVIDYGIAQQIRDIAPAYLVSVVSGVAAYFVKDIVNLNDFFLLFTQTVVYLTLFLSLSYMFKLDGLHIFISIAKEKFFRRKEE